VTASFRIGDLELHSRLIIGSGKFRSFDENRKALDAGGCEMTTVAVRRVDLAKRDSGSLLDAIPPDRFHIIPNTAGCTTVKEAVTTAQLARELLDTKLVKLEVIGDTRTLFPDTVATIEAARILVADGFVVLPYITDDPVACQRLEEAGCAAVMPLGAPIGSGLGIRNPANVRIILESVSCPVIIDAGVGTASDAAIAMELGVDGVLLFPAGPPRIERLPGWEATPYWEAARTEWEPLLQQAVASGGTSIATTSTTLTSAKCVGSPEIGVYALRMKKLPAAELNAGLPRGQGRLIKGRIAIFFWSDARADAPDRGCFDVVRRHIEAVDFR
jgi:thiazole synthase